MNIMVQKIINILGNSELYVPIVQLAVSIWVAFVATIALTTWKKQIKAQKYADFINELTDVVHSFLLSMSLPVNSLKFVKIGIDSYEDVCGLSKDENKNGVIDFIRKHGVKNSKIMHNQLELIMPILSKMKSLVAKGQILEIKNYSKCHSSCVNLEWSFNQIEAFSFFIGQTSLNWEHPEVLETLNKIMSINPDEIEENLKTQSIEYLKFAKEAYKNI